MLWAMDEAYREEGRRADPQEALARTAVAELFDRNRGRVFFSRQIEVLYEDEYFHWITNRAIRDLVEAGEVRGERRQLRTGGEIHLLRHREYRYYRREAGRVVGLVEEYADPCQHRLRS